MTTRAILIERLGPPEVLVEREVELRLPGPGEVHLRVLAAGVNFADLMMRMGLYGTVPPRPFSPGFEVAGEIVRTGEGAGAWRAGDRAIGLMRHGGYARDVVLPADHLFPWPGDLSPAHAAALPVGFLTAWVCLFRAGAARAGETVLVLGAAGGVGTAAVQLARRGGLRVFGTAGTPAKRDFVETRLGADACFDSGGDWEYQLRATIGPCNLDLALDPVGGGATRACRRLLAPLGRIVFYGMSRAAPGTRRDWLRVAWAWLRTPRIHPLDLVAPNQGVHGVHLLHLGSREGLLREAYAAMLPEFASGALFPVLDRSFPLTAAGAAAAHAHLHQRRNLGKVVLAMEAPGARVRAPAA
jgi:NADPH:quinone reductase-like Zn-dependent oxidoreductase